MSSVPKVILDTCVLVSASVHGFYEETGISLEHKFYGRTIPLFDILRKNIDKRIGVVTFTVEMQALTVLAKAVTEALEEESERNPDQRMQLFMSYSALFDKCHKDLYENLEILVREPIPPDQREKHYLAVSAMYDRFEDSAGDLDVDKLIRANVTPRYYKTVRNEIYGQYQKRFHQVLKLKQEPVEDSDKMILAEAVYLHSCRSDATAKTYLASTDYHFSPINSEGPITDEIRKRFGIICDWPDKIAANLMSDGIL